MSDNELRVCSYNIHKGLSSSNRRFLLDDIRHAIRLTDTDLVFLQEVVGHGLGYGKTGGSDPASQFEFLADQVWPHYAYGKNAVVDDGHHGNAILSKHPIVEWHNHDLSRWKFSRRGALYGRLDNGVKLLCVHLGLLGRERRYQLRRLREVINEVAATDEPLILAGDFNDWRLVCDKYLRRHQGFSEVMTCLNGRVARTYPAMLPVMRMDRIYYRNMELADGGLLSGWPWRRLSDHAALMAVFKL